jgi:flavin-dependent dehydrogenase
LIVSVSGISNRTLPHLDEFRQQLDSRNVPASLFVAPRLKGGYRLDSDDATVDWLQRRRSTGDAVVLHGFDEAATKRMRSEFATLPAHEANLRLIGADRAVTVIIENALNQNRMLTGPQLFALGIADAMFDGADFLEREAVEIRTGCAVTGIERDGAGNVRGVVHDGTMLPCDAVILAGQLSQPAREVGAGAGHDSVEAVEGHEVSRLSPDARSGGSSAPQVCGAR